MMSDDRRLDKTLKNRIDRLCDQFESKWRAGDTISIEEFLAGWDEPERTQLKAELEAVRCELERGEQETFSTHAYESLPMRRSGLETSLPERFGRYRILQSLGVGGMGEVHLAEDSQLHRKVALKVPRFSSPDEEQTSRFFREARAAAVLHHPNICPVHDVGDIEGQLYISMAYIDGESLRDLIKSGRRFADHEVIDIVHRLAGALQEAHEAGIIHRDLKPANIMIDRRGEPESGKKGLANPSGSNPSGPSKPIQRYNGHTLGNNDAQPTQANGGKPVKRYGSQPKGTAPPRRYDENPHIDEYLREHIETYGGGDKRYNPFDGGNAWEIEMTNQKRIRGALKKGQQGIDELISDKHLGVKNLDDLLESLYKGRAAAFEATDSNTKMRDFTVEEIDETIAAVKKAKKKIGPATTTDSSPTDRSAHRSDTAATGAGDSTRRSDTAATEGATRQSDTAATGTDGPTRRSDTAATGTDGSSRLSETGPNGNGGSGRLPDDVPNGNGGSGSLSDTGKRVNKWAIWGRVANWLGNAWSLYGLHQTATDPDLDSADRTAGTTTAVVGLHSNPYVGLGAEIIHSNYHFYRTLYSSYKEGKRKQEFRDQRKRLRKFLTDIYRDPKRRHWIIDRDNSTENEVIGVMEMNLNRGRPPFSGVIDRKRVEKDLSPPKQKSSRAIRSSDVPQVMQSDPESRRNSLNKQNEALVRIKEAYEKNTGRNSDVSLRNAKVEATESTRTDTDSAGDSVAAKSNSPQDASDHQSASSRQAKLDRQQSPKKVGSGSDIRGQRDEMLQKIRDRTKAAQEKKRKALEASGRAHLSPTRDSGGGSSATDRTSGPIQKATQESAVRKSLERRVTDENHDADETDGSISDFAPNTPRRKSLTPSHPTNHSRSSESQPKRSLVADFDTSEFQRARTEPHPDSRVQPKSYRGADGFDARDFRSTKSKPVTRKTPETNRRDVATAQKLDSQLKQKEVARRQEIQRRREITRQQEIARQKAAADYQRRLAAYNAKLEAYNRAVAQQKAIADHNAKVAAYNRAVARQKAIAYHNAKVAAYNRAVARQRAIAYHNAKVAAYNRAVARQRAIAYHNAKVAAYNRAVARQRAIANYNARVAAYRRAVAHQRSHQTVRRYSHGRSHGGHH